MRPCLSLLVDPDNGNIVYAGTNGNGVYKSTDGGASFVRIGSPRRGIVFSLAKSGDKLYAATDLGACRVSRDGGATWRNTGAAEGRGLALSTDSAGAVYLGTNLEGAFVLPGDPSARPRANPKTSMRQGRPGQQVAAPRLEAAQELRLPGWARRRDRSFGPRARLLRSRRRTPRDRERRPQLEGRQPPWHASRAPPPSWRSTRSNPGASTRAHSGGGLFKSVDHGKHWVRRSFGFEQSDTSLPWPSTRSTIRCTSGTVFADGHLEEHRLRRHLHPHRSRPRRSSRRVSGPERPRDHGRSEQPHHRLLRRPRHRHLAIAGRRRELDQRRHEPRRRT